MLEEGRRNDDERVIGEQRVEGNEEVEGRVGGGRGSGSGVVVASGVDREGNRGGGAGE